MATTREEKEEVLLRVGDVDTCVSSCFLHLNVEHVYLHVFFPLVLNVCIFMFSSP